MASVNQIRERNLDVGHGAQNSLLAYAHRILTAATPFCSLLPPLTALANVPASLSAHPVLVAAIPFGDAPRADFHPSLAPAAAIAPLCAGWLGWLMGPSAPTRRARRPRRAASPVSRPPSPAGPPTTQSRRQNYQAPNALVSPKAKTPE